MEKVIKITIEDKAYPETLRHIHNPPKTLYCRGNINLLHTDCIAVVGTRKLTAYGKEAAYNISSQLAEKGFTVVSGLAMGIDAVAHRAALDVQGKTIAVLGSAVEDRTIYPQMNLHLAHSILDNEGLIISEYPKGTEGYKSNFPERNRIISGLSIGTLVVEADIKSGSLITARLALEQNRDVFAVPGSIFSKRSFGPNKLIQQGAKAVMSATDIISEYQPTLDLPDSLSTQDPSQHVILDVLHKTRALSIDEIVQKTNLSAPTALSSLTLLEIEGKIHISNGKYIKA